MKVKILAAALLLCLGSQAQQKEGKIIYQRTVQMQRPQNLPAEIAANFPRQRQDQYELLFTNAAMLWQVIPAAEGAETEVSAGGNNFRFRAGGGDDAVFVTLADGKRTGQRSIMDREFLVQDSVTRLPWKISSETKEILGHKAVKATAQRIAPVMRMAMENGEMKRQQVQDTSQIVAWFTPAIPVAVGPAEFAGQLPGAILELSVNGGRTLYQAMEQSNKVNVAAIKEPKGGKKLTAAEFNIERDKLLEEMRRNNPNSNRVIRVQN